ncbi:hypothetical protein BN946_scf185002.g6, partial [Trametes cinnabarina]
MTLHKRVAAWMNPSAWALEPEPSTFAPTDGRGGSRWSNKDMDPVPPQKVKAPIQALPAIALGHVIIATVMVLNGTVGARLHVSFPVLNRSSFGFYCSYFSVISRMVLSMFWLGIQAYTGSQCVYQVPILKLLMPLMFVSPQKIRWFFLFKAVIVPPAWFAILIWAFVKVPASKGLFVQHSKLSGSAFSYAWLSGLNSALGIYSTLAVNIPDFTRYAKNERAQYVQLLVIPAAFTLVGFIGIAVTSAGVVLYGSVLWNPLTLIDHWENRPAAFFAAFTFALATLGTNISANTLSAANDLTVLFPKYINIRRGQVISAIVGPWAFVPWEIVTGAQGFLAFMNGYTVFLGPFAGVMVADNWRAVVTMLVAVPPNMPGLISSVNPSVRVGGAVKVFDFAWLFGFFVSLTVYSFLSLVFPAEETFVEEAIIDGSEEVFDDDNASQDTKRSQDKEIVVA